MFHKVCCCTSIPRYIDSPGPIPSSEICIICNGFNLPKKDLSFQQRAQMAYNSANKIYNADMAAKYEDKLVIEYARLESTICALEEKVAYYEKEDHKYPEVYNEICKLKEKFDVALTTYEVTARNKAKWKRELGV